MKSISIHEERIKTAFSQTGFTELKTIFESEKCVMLPTAVIVDRLKKDYDFSSGKISGIISRAVQKGLLYKVNRGFYVLNVDFPDKIPHCMNVPESKPADIKAIVKSEISECINKLNCNINISELDESEFKYVQNVISTLKNLY